MFLGCDWGTGVGILFLWVLCPSYPSTAAQSGPEFLWVVGETHFCQHPSPTNFLGLTEKEKSMSSGCVSQAMSPLPH